MPCCLVLHQFWRLHSTNLKATRVGFFMAPRLEGPGTADVLVSECVMFVYVLGVVCIGTEIKVKLWL